MRKMLAAGVVLAALTLLSAALAAGGESPVTHRMQPDFHHGMPQGAGQTNERDETTMTVQVSSAEHEAQEGYFTLGDSVTVIAKPGSEIYKFLSRQRGNKIRITMSEAGRPDLSRVER